MIIYRYWSERPRIATAQQRVAAFGSVIVWKARIVALGLQIFFYE
jgi:hypothetical protein